MMLKYLILSMRPAEWVKNLFLFAGLLFGGRVFQLEPLMKVSLGFSCFSLVAGSSYLFNDIHDLVSDRRHPEKKNRPLPSGRLKVSVAYAAAVLLAATGLAGSLWLSRVFAAILLAYLLINVAYTLIIKQAVILDVMCIASGFVLRVLAGAQLAGVVASDWLIICTITLSLFLGFSKRRHELVATGSRPESQRKALGEYSITFLDQLIAVATACTVMSYALYTVSPQTVAHFGTRNLVYTIPFVLYGIYRYLYLVHQRSKGGNPATDLARDVPLLLSSLLWAMAVVWIIY